MRISIILGHPYEESFSSAIFKTVINRLNNSGHIAMFHDLCQEKFDPILSDEELVSGVTRDDRLPSITFF